MHVLPGGIGFQLLFFKEGDILSEDVDLSIGLFEFEFPLLDIGFVEDVVSLCLVWGFDQPLPDGGWVVLILFDPLFDGGHAGPALGVDFQWLGSDSVLELWNVLADLVQQNIFRGQLQIQLVDDFFRVRLSVLNLAPLEWSYQVVSLPQLLHQEAILIFNLVDRPRLQCPGFLEGCRLASALNFPVLKIAIDPMRPAVRRSHCTEPGFVKECPLGIGRIGFIISG